MGFKRQPEGQNPKGGSASNGARAPTNGLHKNNPNPGPPKRARTQELHLAQIKVDEGKGQGL